MTRSMQIARERSNINKEKKVDWKVDRLRMRVMVARLGSTIARPLSPRDLRHRDELPFYTYNETEMQMVAWTRAKRLAENQTAAATRRTAKKAKAKKVVEPDTVTIVPARAAAATAAAADRQAAEATKKAKNRARARRLKERNSKKRETGTADEAAAVKKAVVANRNKANTVEKPQSNAPQKKWSSTEPQNLTLRVTTPELHDVDEHVEPPQESDKFKVDESPPPNLLGFTWGLFGF